MFKKLLAVMLLLSVFAGCRKSMQQSDYPGNNRTQAAANPMETFAAPCPPGLQGYAYGAIAMRTDVATPGYTNTAGFQVLNGASTVCASLVNPFIISNTDPGTNWCGVYAPGYSNANFGAFFRLADVDGNYEWSDYTNGVTTADIARINQHILGIAPFTCFEQFVAADVNRDGFVDGIDMVLIRRVVLGINTSFPAGQGAQAQPFVFMPRIDLDWLNGIIGSVDYESLWPWLQTLITDCQAGEDRLNMVAIKLGDVNFSANRSGLYN